MARRLDAFRRRLREGRGVFLPADVQPSTAALLTRRAGLDVRVDCGRGSSDEAQGKPGHVSSFKLRPMNFSMLRRYSRSSGETKVIASPVAVARPVRPMR